MPVFNYMRLVNNVRVQNAVFQGAVLNYQNVVLQAQKEVEDGLASFSYSKKSAGFLEDSVASAQTSVELSLERYKAGETDYTTVLSSEQQLLSVESSLVQAKGSVLLGLVASYRALGGGWELRSGRDVVSPTVKQEMERTFWWGKMMKPQNHLPPASSDDKTVPPVQEAALP